MAKKLNINKSILLIKLLIEEKEECKDICDLAKREFEESIMQAHHDFNVHDSALDGESNSEYKSANKKSSSDQNNETQSEDSSSTSEKHSHPAWIKKIYRKIAIATHPDKMHKGISEEIKKRYLDIYTKSKISLESYDYMSVVIFANDLGIEIPEKEVAESGIIDIKHRGLSVEIDSMKRSVYWQWANSTDEQKEKILKDFVKSRGWMTKESHRKKSRKGSGKHPGKSIAQMKRQKLYEKK